MCGIKFFFMIMNQHTSQTWCKSVNEPAHKSNPAKSVSPRKPSKSATNFCLDLAPQCFLLFPHSKKSLLGCNFDCHSTLFFFGPHPQKDHNHAFELWLQDTQSKGVQGCSARELPLKDAGKTIPLWSKWKVFYTDDLIQWWWSDA